ncbi:MAG: AMP-binding enzyme [Thermoplasmatota archaeon]
MLVGVQGPPELHYEAHQAAKMQGWTVAPNRPDLPQWPGRFAGAGRVQAVIQTSGTGGTPTDVEITRDMLDAHRPAAFERLQAHGDSIWHASIPPHRIGAVALFDRAMHSHIHFGPTYGPSTHVSMVPTQLYRALEAGIQPTMECALVGGGRLDAELAARAIHAGWPVYSTYGMTETCSQVTTATPEELLEFPNTAGKPLRGVHVRIEEGEIVVRGPTVAGGEVYTGDAGRMDDGRLFVEGRLDSAIITGGVNVYPEPIEEHLEKHPRVEEAAVIGVADPEWGQRVVAYIVGSDADFRDWCRALEPAQRPKEYRFVTELPRTDQGKLRRHLLQNLDGANV